MMRPRYAVVDMFLAFGSGFASAGVVANAWDVGPVELAGLSLLFAGTATALTEVFARAGLR